MKFLSIILLLVSFQSSAQEENGVAVKIFPDKLTFPSSCEIWANPLAKEFSLLLSCKSPADKQYFFNFRLNNIDIIADLSQNSTDVVVNKSQFKLYTLYELTAKDSDGNLLTPASYCTKEICLDLVGEYEDSVKASITSQLKM